MNADELSKWIGPGLLTVVGGLLGWRGYGKVRHDNAKDALDSRQEEKRERELDAARGKISELQGLLQQSRDGRALLERQTREQARKIKNLLEMLGDNERKSAERWIKESEFAPFESGSGRRKP